MGGKKQLAIIGFKGCGKSTVGHLLAEKMGRPFQDTDQILENLYMKKNGEKIGFREIYVRHGRDFFEELETEAVEEAMDGEPKVISFG
ncbi:MAG: shikimate kinase, partial [Nitrospinota bacterium]|nr:shikimate kinase [Nitrospinota bacterium]